MLKAQLVRSSVQEDWGIRLQGGADIGSPLCIYRVSVCFSFGVNVFRWFICMMGINGLEMCLLLLVPFDMHRK